MQLKPRTQQPFVSIIINNYNYGRFLRDAINSALGQSYSHFEVIVVDDGSTDESREIIASYGENIRPIYQANRGQASAFNSGFAASHGDLVIFLDADDMLLRDTARRVSETFEATPDVAKIQYCMEVIDAEGTRTGTVKPSPHLPRLSGDLRRQVLSFPFDLTWMATSGNAFAASVLRRILPMPEREFRILADYYLSHLTPLFGPVIILDEIGAFYRIHGRNNYEQSDVKLNLEQLRRTIISSNNTQVYIQEYANKLGLRAPRSGANPQSVSLLAERLISLKLEPLQHPVPGDTLSRLFWQGASASLHRFDVKMPLRLLFVAWFVAMVPAPRPIARWLAERFYFPESRRHFNRVIGALNRVR